MKWFEPILIIAIIVFVITIFYFHFFHRKKKKNICGCSSKCGGCVGKCHCHSINKEDK